MKSFALVLLWLIPNLVMAQPEVGRPDTLFAMFFMERLRVRIVGEDEGGITRAVLVNEETCIPSLIQPYRCWLVWDLEYSRPYHLRALPFRTIVATPEGTYGMEVVPITIIEAGPNHPEGLAVFVEFDPEEKLARDIPLSDEEWNLLQAVVDHQVMTPDQLQTYQSILSSYRDRYSHFKERAQRYVENPDDPQVREVFIRSLAELYGDLIRLTEYRTFFSRDQRVSLRKLGFSIPGFAYAHEKDGIRTTTVKDFPLGEFVKEWNENPMFLLLPEERPILHLSDGFEYEEIDLTFEMVLEGQASERLKNILDKLKDIEGIWF